MKFPWPFGKKAVAAPIAVDTGATPEMVAVAKWIVVLDTDNAKSVERREDAVAWQAVYDAKRADRWKTLEARAVLDAPEETRGRMAIACLRAAKLPKETRAFSSEMMNRCEMLCSAAARLLRKPGTLARAEFRPLVDAWSEAYVYAGLGIARLTGLLEELVASGGLTLEVEEPGRRLLALLGEKVDRWHSREDVRAYNRLAAVLEPHRAHLFTPGRAEPWQGPFDGNPSLEPLVAHAQRATTVKMSRKWREDGRRILDSTTGFLDSFEKAIDGLAGMSIPTAPDHSDELRGLVWALGIEGSERAVALLGRVIRVSAHKLTGFGPRASKAFGAAVAALENLDGFPALSVLSETAHAVVQPNLADVLRLALTRSAERQGIPIAEIEELVVPSFGLALGRWTQTFDDVIAEVAIVGTTDVEVRWSREGKTLKSAPASVKEAHGEEWKDLKRQVKEIGESLAAQRSRIEGLLLSERRLPYRVWRERYLDHPLVGPISRRLIWRFDTGSEIRSGIAPDGEVIDAESRTLADLDDAIVSLWHPLGAGVAAIEMWREFLAERNLAQPFKQAYREIYLLTDAERRTNLYSNRFAAHILKQHQFAALARARDWRYALMGYFDSFHTPTRRFGSSDLRVEFNVMVAGWDVANRNELSSESGIALYVTTDSVVFLDHEHRPVPLADVPPLLFTEAMRDVDLFVGVASVGNDPTWGDQAERFGQTDAWQTLAFGALGATAETRRAVLERLLPRLAIRSVARLEGRFLVVRGRLGTYRIHLGSSNILMAPDDRYLCIVPTPFRKGEGGKAGHEIPLPFEGDGTLASILSKAVLLAKDDEITDPTILTQLRRERPQLRIPVEGA